MPGLAALPLLLALAAFVAAEAGPGGGACAAASASEAPSCRLARAAGGEHLLLQTKAVPQRTQPQVDEVAPEGLEVDDVDVPKAEDFWYQELLVARHNRYRCLHGVPALRWNVEIERSAKRWALFGQGRYKSPRYMLESIAGFELLGENIAIGFENSTGPGGPEGAVDMWYSQMPLPEGRVQELDYMTARYTQVVWRNSTDLGCGLWSGIVVCQYGAAGNVEGQFGAEVRPLLQPAPTCE